MKQISRIFNIFIVASLIVATVLSAQPVQQARAAAFTVTTNADSGAGSLRQAIIDANLAGGTNTITVPAMTITLSDQLPQVTSIITITGVSAGSTIVQANAASNTATYRVFEVGGAGNLTLDKLTVRNGKCDGSCATESWGGGGIYNNGILTVKNSTISNNFSVDNSFGFGGGIFNENNSTTLTITNTKFQGNSATKAGGGIYNKESSNTVLITDGFFDSNTVPFGSGGGIFNKTGTMTLTSTSPSLGFFVSNTAPNGDGAGIANGGILNVTNIDFVSNSASTGAGLSNIDGTANITGSLFSTNTATSSGGGIMVSGTTNITTSSFHDNTAANGGGISANFGGTLTLKNSTLYKNIATGNGGGISNRDNMVVNNSTFSENSASNGGAVYSNPFDRFNSNGQISTVSIKNTILANSTAGRDCFFTNDVSGATVTGNNNIIEADGSAAGADTNDCGTTSPITTDPKLGTLAGFPLPQYYPLLTGSPAINAGENASCETTSQNGAPRPQGAACDIGSFELDTTPPTVTAFTVPAAPTSLNIPVTSFTATDNVGVTGYLITTSSTLPLASAAGWTSTAPTTFSVPNDGTFTLFPWAKDAGGNVSAVFATPRTVLITISSPTTLVNSVLPTSRSIPVGALATIFNSVINAGTNTASGVTLSMNPAPDGTFTYLQTNCATNAIISGANPTLDLAPGAVLCYVLSFTPSAAFTATNVHIRAQASNAPSTNLLVGINTWLLRASTIPGPDIIAQTTTTDFHQVACSGINAFAVATANVGTSATGVITASAHTGSAVLPVDVLIQETNPATGAVIGTNVLSNVLAGQNRTVAVFVTFKGCIAFDPAANRIFIEFKDASNNVVGSTSTAISTGR